MDFTQKGKEIHEYIYVLYFKSSILIYIFFHRKFYQFYQNTTKHFLVYAKLYLFLQLFEFRNLMIEIK